MKVPLIIALSAWTSMHTIARADSPASPRPWVATSERGDYLFKMVPTKWRKEGNKYVVEREAFGVAYKIAGDGKFEDIWRTKGWYTFKGYLSEDGRYLVRFGHWARDQEKHTDLAIAFYDRGKLLKGYQVRELIKKPDLLEDSVSHYMWRPAIQTDKNGFRDGTFHLVMIDKTTYSFDYQTGEIIATDRDEDAKSNREIWADEQKATNKRSRELSEASAFKGEFQRHFDITSISLEGPTWVAEFTPKRRLEHEASASLVFPIRDDNRVEISLTPRQILAAIEKAFRHPFVVQRFKDGGATGMHLRIQVDRLHGNTPELAEFLEKITGNRPKADKLGHWAHLTINDKDHQYTSIYLNTQTGEIIAEDESKQPRDPFFTKWPRKPFLIDASGKRMNPKKR